jgi:hypothetical protein
VDVGGAVPTGVFGGTPSVNAAVANPQPDSCPKRRDWDYSPVSGSDALMVPGDPVAAVSCSVPRQRRVIRGSQLAQIVDLLNSRPLLDPNACPHPNIGGLVLITTQMYFNYTSGDIQIVNFNPNCETVSNGELTAKFGQSVGLNQ